MKSTEEQRDQVGHIVFSSRFTDLSETEVFDKLVRMMGVEDAPSRREVVRAMQEHPDLRVSRRIRRMPMYEFCPEDQRERVGKAQYEDA